MKDKLEIAKHIVKENIYRAPYGIYNHSTCSPSESELLCAIDIDTHKEKVGNIEAVAADDYLRIVYNTELQCIEVVGLSDKEFKELKWYYNSMSKAMNKEN